MTQQRQEVFVNGIPDPGGASVEYKLPYEQQAGAPIVFTLATVADDISPWGLDPVRRDMQLRSFWPTEPTLASAVYSICARNAAFSWTLEGPQRTVNQVQDIFHMADGGDGWQSFVLKVCQDLLTQDNGCFIEVIRSGPAESDPVIGIGHLDAGRCVRTGVEEWPVKYYDRIGRIHKLRPWQVLSWAEFPSPVVTMNGVGLSAVSRILRVAQYLRDIEVYGREKVAGRNPQALYLVGGISTNFISDAVKTAQSNADNRGLARYMIPLILGSLDPTASIKVDKIDLASLPDGFDTDVVMRWFITQLALAFGADYQDFAPLPGGNIGSSAQSLILAQKSRGKGPALFMKGMEYRFNFHGVLPRSVTFTYDEQDAAADMEQAELRKLRAEARKLDIETGVLTPEAGRQQMLDDGDLSVELFDAMQTGPDLTDDVTVQDNTREDATTGGDASATATAPVDAEKSAKAAEASDFAEEDRAEWENEYAALNARILRQNFATLRRNIMAAGNKGLLSIFNLNRKEEEDDTVIIEPKVQAAMDNPEWWAKFRAGMVDGLSTTFRTVGIGAGQYNLDLGLPVDMMSVNQAVLDLTRTYSDEWWAEIEATTRRAMRTALENWQTGALGSRGLPDLVDSLTPLFGQTRAELIASTETTRMFDLGNRAAYESAGIERVEFQTVRDELVCPICSPLNGERYPLKESPRPPLHPRCRCAVLPVANDRVFEGKG